MDREKKEIPIKVNFIPKLTEDNGDLRISKNELDNFTSLIKNKDSKQFSSKPEYLKDLRIKYLEYQKLSNLIHKYDAKNCIKIVRWLKEKKMNFEQEDWKNIDKKKNDEYYENIESEIHIFEEQTISLSIKDGDINFLLEEMYMDRARDEISFNKKINRNQFTNIEIKEAESQAHDMYENDFKSILDIYSDLIKSLKINKSILSIYTDLIENIGNYKSIKIIYKAYKNSKKRFRKLLEQRDQLRNKYIEYIKYDKELAQKKITQAITSSLKEIKLR